MPRPPESAVDNALPVVALDELMRGQREIAIVFSNQIYRLRITRNGKLILTK